MELKGGGERVPLRIFQNTTLFTLQQTENKYLHTTLILPLRGLPSIKAGAWIFKWLLNIHSEPHCLQA